MSKEILADLERARNLLAGRQRRFPIVPIEMRAAMADALFSEESINRLVDLQYLNRPFELETPPWEDDEILDEFLNESAKAAEEEKLERFKLKEEAQRRLEEAQREYDDFMAKPKGKRCSFSQVVNTCTAKSSDKQSKDDLHVPKSGKATILRRRPSFMADTSQSNIEVNLVCSNCQEPNEAVLHSGDLAAICSQERKQLPNTSTPHVPRRLLRALSIGDAQSFFEESDRSVRKSRCSSTHLDGTLQRQRTFECGQKQNGLTKENENPNEEVKSGDQKPRLKRENTTVIQPQETTVVLKPTDTTTTVVNQTQPRIAPRSKTLDASKRPTIARPSATTRALPKPTLARPVAKATQPILPSKVSTTTAAKVSRTATFSKPAKSCLRPPQKK